VYCVGDQSSAPVAEDTAQQTETVDTLETESTEPGRSDGVTSQVNTAATIATGLFDAANDSDDSASSDILLHTSQVSVVLVVD